MTTCLGKSCSFGLLSFVNVYNFWFLRVWDVIVLIPDYCLSIYLY